MTEVAAAVEKNQKIQQKLDVMEEQVARELTENFNPVRHSAETRSKLGSIFVWGFFVALFGTILFVMLYNVLMFRMVGDTSLFLNLDTVIPLLGSVIGTPLGFVMGYYFKTEG